MRNLEWCVYTYKHRLAFNYVAKRLIRDESLLNEILERGKTHDVDKLLLYMFMSWQETIDYHLTHRAHHLDAPGPKSYEDLVEMVIDLECSPYTKPDKPLNCFDFVNRLVERGNVDRDTADRLFDIMRELGIDYSYDVTKESRCKEFAASLPTVTEEMILLDVMEYVRTNPAAELALIRQHEMSNERNNNG